MLRFDCLLIFILNEMFTWDLSSSLKDLKAYWRKQTNPTYYRVKLVSFR